MNNNMESDPNQSTQLEHQQSLDQTANNIVNSLMSMTRDEAIRSWISGGCDADPELWNTVFELLNERFVQKEQDVLWAYNSPDSTPSD